MPFPSTQDQEARFAVFLNPIRDLTKNWEVDIAKYLEEYLEELSEVQITFDGGETRMNFAEAAMLIQGSATVYSKKVEFLWQIVLQMLDLLSSKKKLPNQSENGLGEGFHNPKQKSSSADLTLDFQKADHLGVGNNIDLKDGGSKKPKPFSLMPATPLHLVEKEAEKCKNKINLYLNNMDTFGGKDDFRLNRLYMTPRGLLCLELPPELLQQKEVVFCTPLPTNDRPCSDVDPEDYGGDDVFGQPSSPPPLSPLPNEDPFLPAGDMNEIDEILNIEPVPAENEAVEVEKVVEEPLVVGKDRLRRRVTTASIPDAPIRLNEPWKPMDPHEHSSPPRPVRAGRIRKPIPCTCHKPTPKRSRKRKRGNLAETNEDNKLLPIDQNLLKRLPDLVNNNTKGTVVMSSAQEELHPALRDEILSENLKRLQSKKRLQTLSILEEGVVQTVEEAAVLQEEREKQTADVLNDHLEENPQLPDDGDGVSDDLDFGGGEPFEMPDPHDGIDWDGGGKKKGLNTSLLNDTLQYEPDGEYEALVQKWVADYIIDAQDYIASSDLTHRVNRWRTKISPILALEEERLAFDIHSYGSKILGKFGGIDDVVPFKEVVSGMPKNEVARAFLSSLMLSNTYNVEPILTEPGDFTMDCLSLRLLSRVRHHEEMQEYMAPSQNTNAPTTQTQPQPTGSQQPQRGRTKRTPNTAPSSSDSDSSEDESPVVPGSSRRSDDTSGTSSPPLTNGMATEGTEGVKVNGIIEGLASRGDPRVCADITEKCLGSPVQLKQKRHKHAAVVVDNR